MYCSSLMQPFHCTYCIEVSRQRTTKGFGLLMISLLVPSWIRQTMRKVTEFYRAEKKTKNCRAPTLHSIPLTPRNTIIVNVLFAPYVAKTEQNCQLLGCNGIVISQ